MDRIAPTRRPAGRAIGYQRWRALLFLHWPVPVEVLRPLVPARLGIDVFDGIAYVGLVPFAMEGVRPAWAPEAVAFRFLETNLRTYVHLDGQAPGVYFFSLDAASRVAVHLARWRWGLPYFLANMHLERHEDQVRYAMQRRGDQTPALRVRYRIGETLAPARPDTLAFFFLERYLLYADHGGLRRGQVHHAPYPAAHAHIEALEEDMIAAAGIARPDTAPIAHYASGVDVEIFPLQPV